MPTIIATPGAANANSYLTLVEAQAYFDTRLALAGWDDADDQSVLLIMATRMIDAMFQPLKIYMPGPPPHYRVRRHWSGTPATTTQKLAWPRSGMYDANGNAIAVNVIPQALKEAVAEFAGQLGNEDRTLDNDVIAQGLTSVRAGSVSLTFKDNFLTSVLPDAVMALMPPSWFTDELYEGAVQAEFDVFGVE